MAKGKKQKGKTAKIEKIRFVERVNAVLNYDLKPGQKANKGRGARKEIGQPDSQRFFVEKRISLEDGKGNVLKTKVERKPAGKDQISKAEGKSERKITTKKKRRVVRKRR